MRQYDAVVVGGGHNALVTAALLARERWKVVVLERREVVGGAAATETIFPGCRVNVAAQDAGLFPAELVSDLGLGVDGLEWVRPPALATSLTGGGEVLTLWRDLARTREEIGPRSRTDATRFSDWADYLRQMAVTTMAVEQLDEAMSLLHRTQGGTALREGGAFERRYRDFRAMPVHINVHQDRVTHQLGRHLLGLELNPF